MTLISQSKVVLPGSLVAHDGSFSDGVTFDDYARYILLAISFGACGVLLLISRRPKHGPTTVREIVIPFAATFSSMVFDQHVELPTWMVTPLVPDNWKPALGQPRDRRLGGRAGHVHLRDPVAGPLNGHRRFGARGGSRGALPLGAASDLTRAIFS